VWKCAGANLESRVLPGAVAFKKALV